MSHFTVLVIGDDVTGQLAPYDENIEVTEYDKGAVSQEEIDSFTEYYLEKFPEDAELSLAELYSKHGEAWNGRTWRTINGVYHSFSTYNPKSKWDWYSIGGRWTGFFKLKEKGIGQLGVPGVFGNEPINDVDVVHKRDIDFEGMQKVDKAEAERIYDLLEKTTAGLTPPDTCWSEFVKQFEQIDDARKAYNANPWVAAVGKAHLDVVLKDPVDYYCVHTGGRTEFVRRFVGASGIPYAIVVNGTWYERGRMGWFGVSDEENTAEAWYAKAHELIDSASDDALFTLVDCHI